MPTRGTQEPDPDEPALDPDVRLAVATWPQIDPVVEAIVHQISKAYRLLDSEMHESLAHVGLTKEEVPEFYRLRRNLPGDWDCCGTWGKTSVIVVRSSLSADQTSRWIR